MNIHAANIDIFAPPSLCHDGRDLEVWNTILSYSGTPLPLIDGSASVEFQSAARPPATTPVITIELEDGTRGGVVIRSFPFAAMFGVNIELAELPRLPLNLRDCLEESMVATLWDVIPDRRMGKFHFLGSAPLNEIIGSAGEDSWQWLDVTVEGAAPAAITATVGMPISAFIKAISAGRLGPAAGTDVISTLLTTEAAYTLGSLPLTIAALTRLQSGDIVALPQVSDMVHVRAGWTSYSFRSTDDGWLCVSREPIERYRLDPDTIEGYPMTGVSQSAVDNLTDLGDLNIVLDFDLGRVTVPLSTVQTWQAGSIVALDPPAAENGVQVTIRANGQTIGIGDLIRVDDRIAVRLTRLSISK